MRIPLAVLLVFGGIFSFLPVLGIWMLPLGFLVLAVDIPPLRKPVGDWLVRGQRGLANLRPPLPPQLAVRARRCRQQKRPRMRGLSHSSVRLRGP